MATTARMSKRADSLATELSRITGKDKKVVIETALEKYYHEERMRNFNEAYAKLSQDKAAWKEEQKDREELEGTLSDGIEKE